MTVTELKALAKSLKITGYSKLRKAELILAIGDACYEEAAEDNRTHDIMVMVDEAFPPSIAEIDAAYRAQLPAKRMSAARRIQVYSSKDHGGNRLSARQLKRIRRKALKRTR